jgi:hypothetical protein
MMACETWPEGMPVSVDQRIWKGDISHRTYILRRYILSRETIGISKDDPVICGLDLWAELLERYFYLDLTREEDKLVAIQA